MAFGFPILKRRCPHPLADHTVLITGAASGIGRALCRRLSDKGARLALIDRDGRALFELARELEMAGVRFEVAIADVRNRPSLGEAVDALVRELGPIDIVVASAGVCGISHVDDLNVEQVEEILKVNFLGVVNTIDCVLPSMLSRKSGQIVGIASLAAICGMPLEEAYNASKAALAIYLEGLRPALRRRGVAVTTVFPGFVDTPLLEALMLSMGIPRVFGSIGTAAASEKITRAILRRQRVCSFPRTTTLLVHGARLLPAAALDWTRDRIAARIPAANFRKPVVVGAVDNPGLDHARSSPADQRCDQSTGASADELLCR